MPATRLGKPKRDMESLVKTIRKYIYVENTTVALTAKKMGMAPNTLYARLGIPENITIGELRRLSMVLHIPPEELRPYLI